MTNGVVESGNIRKAHSRYPPEVIKFIDEYAINNPCFYIEELQEEIKEQFPTVPNLSIPTICRCLRFDLKLSKKVLTKRAREATIEEKEAYYMKLRPYYNSSDQLVFVDETAKDNRSTIRKMAWSRINTRAIVKASFERGKRISFLAAYDINGFIATDSTNGTFDRHSFHKIMTEKIIPLMNPYPLPRSILILDNAKIHYYQELIDAVHNVGGVIIFLPPYCPYLNPIELGFSLMKSWIQKHAHLSFKHSCDYIGRLAMQHCTKNVVDMCRQFESCGYHINKLVEID